MNEKIEKVKKHLSEHKEAYLIGGVCFLAGSTGTYLFLNGSDLQKIVPSIIAINGRGNQTINQITLAPKGHRGDMILHNQTGKVYPSQHDAAKALGLNQGDISKHLSGRSPHVRDQTFTSLGENMSPRD